MTEQPHPKSAPGVWTPPNFRLIMILSSVFLLVALVGAYLMLRTDGRHIVPRVPPSVSSQN